MFNDSHTVTLFHVLGKVPDVFPLPTSHFPPPGDRADHVMDDTQSTTMEASQTQESVNKTPTIVNLCPIPPPNPGVSDAIDHTTVPIGLSQATGAVASTSEDDASQLITPAALDHVSMAVKARDQLEKRYQKQQKMVPRTAMTARCEVSWSY